MTQGLHLRIGRRQVLVTAGNLALTGTMPGVADAAARPFLTSETGALRKVLVHPATWEDFAGCGLLAGANPFWLQAAEELVEEHAALARQVEATGAEVLYVEQVLQSAVAEARQRDAWLPWLSATFPELVEREKGGALMLLGRDGRDTGMQGLFRLGDFATMLPRGMALRNVKDDDLARPAALFRFMVRFAPKLQRYPLLEGEPARFRSAFARTTPALVLERA